MEAEAKARKNPRKRQTEVNNFIFRGISMEGSFFLFDLIVPYEQKKATCNWRGEFAVPLQRAPD
jgi:hypothetical protein